VASADADRIEPGRLFRLKDLGNLEAATTTRASYAGNDLGVVRQGAPILHWVPAAHAVPCTVVGVDGTASEGVVEDAVLRERPGAVVQFERVGFARLDAVGRARVRAYFAHR
ncbi:MAG: glutamate--tRNA ligase, partial [Methanobacteriota archaeon]